MSGFIRTARSLPSLDKITYRHGLVSFPYVIGAVVGASRDRGFQPPRLRRGWHYITKALPCQGKSLPYLQSGGDRVSFFLDSASDSC